MKLFSQNIFFRVKIGYFLDFEASDDLDLDLRLPSMNMCDIISISAKYPNDLEIREIQRLYYVLLSAWHFALVKQTYLLCNLRPVFVTPKGDKMEYEHIKTKQLCN